MLGECAKKVAPNVCYRCYLTYAEECCDVEREGKPTECHDLHAQWLKLGTQKV